MTDEWQMQKTWQKEPKDVIDHLLNQPSHPADIKMLIKDIKNTYDKIGIFHEHIKVGTSDEHCICGFCEERLTNLPHKCNG